MSDTNWEARARGAEAQVDQIRHLLVPDDPHISTFDAVRGVLDTLARVRASRAALSQQLDDINDVLLACHIQAEKPAEGVRMLVDQCNAAVRELNDARAALVDEGVEAETVEDGIHALSDRSDHNAALAYDREIEIKTIAKVLDLPDGLSPASVAEAYSQRMKSALKGQEKANDLLNEIREALPAGLSAYSLTDSVGFVVEGYEQSKRLEHELTLARAERDGHFAAWEKAQKEREMFQREIAAVSELFADDETPPPFGAARLSAVKSVIRQNAERGEWLKEIQGILPEAYTAFSLSDVPRRLARVIDDLQAKLAEAEKSRDLHYGVRAESGEIFAAALKAFPPEYCPDDIAQIPAMIEAMAAGVERINAILDDCGIQAPAVDEGVRKLAAKHEPLKARLHATQGVLDSVTDVLEDSPAAGHGFETLAEAIQWIVDGYHARGDQLDATLDNLGDLLDAKRALDESGIGGWETVAEGIERLTEDYNEQMAALRPCAEAGAIPANFEGLVRAKGHKIDALGDKHSVVVEFVAKLDGVNLADDAVEFLLSPPHGVTVRKTVSTETTFGQEVEG